VTPAVRARSTVPCFSRRALRQAIPSSYFQPSTARSVAYLLQDLALLALVYALAAQIQSPWFIPFVWLVQGTLWWALFVIGHDCGHGSFSRYPALNSWVGHLTHTPLLVPYHAWRLSHRLHHRHAGDIDRDETWFPLTAAQVSALPWYVRLLRYRLFLVVLPFYLLRRTPARVGSHFNPRSPLFPRSEEHRVRVSVVACGAMVLLLIALGVAFGPFFLVRHYLGPYLVFAVWLDLVTYLHHTDPELPWYRGTSWTFVRGALSTMDRDYGFLERIHHNAGTHLAHHLFPTIPHYHLREATEALRLILGSSHRVAGKSIWSALRDSARTCVVVPEHGDCVRYQPLPSTAGPRPATR
jgi:omega-3 fatty acid desaturase (delta-15 desaturase)